MINAMTAETEEQKLLPMKKTTFLPEDMPALVGTGLYQEDMVFWPSTHSVMANIVPNYINGIVYGLSLIHISKQISRSFHREEQSVTSKYRICRTIFRQYFLLCSILDVYKRQQPKMRD